MTNEQKQLIKSRIAQMVSAKRGQYRHANEEEVAAKLGLASEYEKLYAAGFSLRANTGEASTAYRSAQADLVKSFYANQTKINEFEQEALFDLTFAGADADDARAFLASLAEKLAKI